MAEILVSQLHKAFGDTTAVKSSTFIVRDGSFCCLLGPSGCGKTTTLRMIAGLELPTSGSIRLGGEDVTFQRASRRDIAFVFQLFALYPHMGVRANIAFPLKCQGVASDEIDRRVKEAAAILRIGHLLDRPVTGLASGDRQRVALGRAIVRKPKAFLMDEPLGTLDAEMRELMCVELRRLHDRLGTTTVFVTHDQNEAMALADQIIVMDRGEILQVDPPDGVYNLPGSLFVAGFIGRPAMNLMKAGGPVRAGDVAVRLDGSVVAIPMARGDAAQAIVGVRPEHVQLVAPGAGAMPGRVAHIEYFGSHWIAEVETSAGSLKALVDKAARPAEGDAVGLAFRTERVVVFDAVTQRLVPGTSAPAHSQGASNGQHHA
jgi:multiple sugar transport system ATP-binding protein